MRLYEFDKLINRTLDKLFIEEEVEWNYSVKKIIVVLSASRSGSSLLFNLLSSSKESISTVGEHEPWMLLSKNKFPYTESDYIDVLRNKELLLALLRNDLITPHKTAPSQDYLHLLNNRLAIRNIALPADTYKKIIRMSTINTSIHKAIMNDIIKTISEDYAPPTSHKDLKEGHYSYPIENPPFIDIPLARIATKTEISNKTLIFKSPSDSYRHGIYEELFPQAKITYLHLTRGYAQSINGLIDGWLSQPYMFISNATNIDSNDLNIEGYSTNKTTKTYWCFDLYPSWQEDTSSSLLNVCSKQWIYAHANILENYVSKHSLQFEQLYKDKKLFINSIERILGDKINSNLLLQPVMTTEKPKEYRWHHRKDTLLNLQSHLASNVYSELIRINERLGYSNEYSSWH